jgi:hypothetical protein
MAFTNVSFKCSDEDRKRIHAIAERARGLYLEYDNDPNKVRDLQSIEMDITAVHCNGCPLRLGDLLATADFHFLHDVSKIECHLDRTTGKLTGYFRPRFAQKEVANGQAS